MKIGFLNTNFYNIPFKFNKGITPSIARVSFAGSGDTFEKTTPQEDKRVADEAKKNISTVKPWAKRLSNDADAAFKIFKTKMENVFSNVCNSRDREFDWIPEETAKGELVTNKKSLTSIIEKMLSGGKKTEKEARAAIQDTIRARVVLKNGTQAEGDAICNEIMKAVKKNKLEIKEIRNYTTGDDMQYVSQKAIRKLEKAIDETYGKNSYTSYKKTKNTGYNALHIIFKIDNEFNGELQIMGKNVEKLKDVEDVFYKLKHNKHVSKKYDEIKKKYNSLYAKKQNAFVEELEAYIRDAYLLERKKELGLIKYKDRFLPLNTNKYDLPKEFDFNYIASIKD